jgi:hypothetical protein
LKEARVIRSHSAGNSEETAFASAIRESGVHDPVARADRTSGGRSFA